MKNKYSVQFTKNSKDALQINQETETDYWEKATSKEMKKAKVSYEEVGGFTTEDARSGNVPEITEYQEISLHLILYVNMEFTRKANFVTDGSTTKTPVALCYLSVVSRDRVR